MDKYELQKTWTFIIIFAALWAIFLILTHADTLRRFLGW